jgi:thiol-disulfide isomerase/thioredoxin
LLAEHAGHPVITHFWGLTCGPCLAELPKWGQFAATHPNVRLVVIAADPMPQPPDQLAATLDRAGLSKAESWAFDGAFPARLYFEVDASWQGELPRTTLLDPRGGQTTWLGATHFPRINTWLASQAS